MASNPLFRIYGGAKALGRRNRPKSIFRGALGKSLVEAIGSAADMAGMGSAASNLLKSVGAARPIIDMINRVLRATGGGKGGGSGRKRAGASDGGDERLEQALDIAEAFLREHRPELFQPHPAQTTNRGKATDPGTYPLQPIQQPGPGINTGEPQPSAGTRPEGRITARTGGRTIFVDENDPLITGEMIPVESSNVHSIGFEWDGQSQKGTLKIRFLQSDKRKQSKAKVAGPLYRYDDVHPYVFEAMRAASSKGKFVWDRIRIRGTVSGHQYRYKLAGIAQGYVPRQAVAYGQGQRRTQYFVQRQQSFTNVRTGEVRTFTSALEDRRVGAYRPDLRAVASRGIPNRGTPNRGR